MARDLYNDKAIAQVFSGCATVSESRLHLREEAVAHAIDLSATVTAKAHADIDTFRSSFAGLFFH